VIADAFGAVEEVSGTRAACGAVGRSRATHYRSRLAPVLGPPSPRPTPPNALDPAEQDAVLGVLRGRFVDAAPAQAWATLLDEGTYLASESTMYRLLRASGEVPSAGARPPTRPTPSPSWWPSIRTRSGPTT
jgi:putative transposase